MASRDARDRDVRRTVEGRARRAAEARAERTSEDERRRRGIVHTPPELARFCARVTDAALRRLGRPGGLSDPDVVLLDPASGPGAFLAAALRVASPGAPRDALGLEVDPDAAESARAVLAPAASAAGWPLRIEVRDTLADLAAVTESLPRDATVAILGNPPWSGRSATRGDAASDALLEPFRRDGSGALLTERKLGVLSDEYVRFWAWAAAVARDAPGGAVVTLVTNGSYLDGPVHRGMRAALRRWFGRLDVLDLGGSALIARRGGSDGNVFGVRPPVAVACASRAAAGPGAGGARVRYGALRGSRDDKLERLGRAAGFRGLGLTRIRPRAPLHLFVPTPPREPAYRGWPSVTELFPFHREGLQSNRDAFCVDVDRDALAARVRAFAQGRSGPWPGRVDRPSRHYDPARARLALERALAADPRAERVLHRLAYRPLDHRWVLNVTPVCHRPRPALARALRHGGPCLVTVRKDRGERPWAHVALVRHLPDNCWLSARSSCRTRAFPAFGPDGAPNVGAGAGRLCGRLDAGPTADALIRYAAGVLAGERYRRRFDGHLRLDYPRVPPPPDAGIFRRAVDAGLALEEALAHAEGPAVNRERPLALGHHDLRGRPGGRRLADALARCDAAAAAVLDAHRV
ncbi:MAG: type ISP restriction/modification enzyme [Sandaracinaceae bacterium]